MRIHVASMTSSYSGDPGLQERLLEEGLRLAAKRLSSFLDQPLQVAELSLELGIPFSKISQGYFTERAAANLIADRLVDSVLSQHASDVVTTDSEGRRAYIFFGEKLAERPKSLQQLLAERISDKSHQNDSWHWVQQAREQLAKLPGINDRITARDAALLQWVHDQGPNPAPNPLAKNALNDKYAPYAKRARKLIAELHAAAPSPGAFAQAVKAKARELRQLEDDDHKVAVLLDHYLDTMIENAQEPVYEAHPEHAEVDEYHRAARMALQATPSAPNFVKLPPGVPTLGEPQDALFKAYQRNDVGKQAAALARTTIAMARSMGNDPSHQYYFLEIRINTYRRSSDPVKATAAAILSRFLLQEKKAWVPGYVQQLLHQAPAGQVSYDLNDDVRYEGSDDPLPADSRHRKKVKNAWDQIRKIVHPDILNKVGPCKVRIHKSPFFRAHYNHGEVHVNSVESVPIIMHEFGHHLEDQGGLETWIKVQRMLHERAAAGGGLKSISMFTPSELRFAADMPVTGDYSAKYYAHGSTEVVSMGMEYFGNPKNAAALYMKDPEMFQAVLGSLNPMKP